MKKIKLLLLALCTVSTLAGNKVEAKALGGAPKVDITGYSLTDESIAIGEETVINFEFTNESSTAVSDVLVTYSSINNLVLPVYGSSNQFYISKIGAHKTESVDLPVTILGSNEGYVDIEFDIEYVSGNVNYSNTSSFVSFPINVLGSIQVNNVNVASTSQAGAQTLISISLKNSGEEAIDDVKMVVEGDVTDGVEEISIGNIEAGASISTDKYIKFDEVGEKNITISFNYLDANDQVKTITGGNYKVTVTENDGSKSYYDDENDKSSGLNTISKMILVFIGVIFVAAVVVFVFGKRKARK